eukprot:COSAG05_NODE_6426_length_961_cov_1.006961_2_plen_181_part_00
MYSQSPPLLLTYPPADAAAATHPHPHRHRHPPSASSYSSSSSSSFRLFLLILLAQCDGIRLESLLFLAFLICQPRCNRPKNANSRKCAHGFGGGAKLPSEFPVSPWCFQAPGPRGSGGAGASAALLPPQCVRGPAAHVNCPKKCDWFWRRESCLRVSSNCHAICERLPSAVSMSDVGRRP